MRFHSKRQQLDDKHLAEPVHDESWQKIRFPVDEPAITVLSRNGRGAACTAARRSREERFVHRFDRFIGNDTNRYLRFRVPIARRQIFSLIRMTSTRLAWRCLSRPSGQFPRQIPKDGRLQSLFTFLVVISLLRVPSSFTSLSEIPLYSSLSCLSCSSTCIVYPINGSLLKGKMYMMHHNRHSYARRILRLSISACGRWSSPCTVPSAASLHRILHKFTSTPVHGLVVGTAATAVLQSSTAVTVMSIGMVNAGLLTFPRTLGIVFGTNIGTCLTTELIGLNLNQVRLPLLNASLALGC